MSRSFGGPLGLTEGFPWRGPDRAGSFDAASFREPEPLQPWDLHRSWR
ncbi:hypothetical protein ACFFX0_15215 [Citricoccus parietis]|uniref:Uncharacterized protein n=1 Tax=Citricoccus parietis TaxID=592307 RepID=A0ABV5G0K4_9MICC